jgi:hypothetical protein
MSSGGEITTGSLGNTLVKYGEYTFSEYTNTKFSMVAVNSPDGLTVSHYECELTVDSIVPKGYLHEDHNFNDADVLTVKSYLEKPNQRLQVNNSGYGAIDVLASDNYINVIGGGPLPVKCEIENLGDGQTSRIVWIVTWKQLRDVDETGEISVRSQPTDILWMTHETALSVSKRSRITERITIKAELRSGVTFNTSSYEVGRDAIRKVFEQIQGVYHVFMLFAKSDWDIKLSPDRRLITIESTNEQVDSDIVYPPAVEHIEIKHRSNSDLARGFQIWSNEFMGTVTLYPNADKMIAWIVYRAHFIERYNKGIQQIVEKQGYKKVSKVYYPRIQTIEIEDTLYNTHTLRFRVTYDLNVNNVSEIFARTGLLTKPTPIADAGAWASGSPGKYEPIVQYGLDQIKVKDIDPAITTASDGSAFLAVKPNQLDFYSQNNPQQSITQTECPPPEDSWLDYQVKLSFVNNRNTNKHERYEDVTAVTPQSGVPSTAYQVTMDAQTEVGDTTSSNQILHITGPASQKLEMRGYALRFGGPTDTPQISSIGGVTVQLDQEWVSDQIISSSTCPLHYTMWVKTYYITGQIQPGVSVLDNMDQGIAPEEYQHE